MQLKVRLQQTNQLTALNIFTSAMAARVNLFFHQLSRPGLRCYSFWVTFLRYQRFFVVWVRLPADIATAKSVATIVRKIGPPDFP